LCKKKSGDQDKKEDEKKEVSEFDKLFDKYINVTVFNLF
jgi:hypothetical protein